MSGPSQRPSFNSSDPSSPRSPQPRGNIPVSFRTNVNRAKTRRWVEAKKYSYDGDDWGEDEYGEYEYDDDHLTPQAQSAGANHSTPDIPSTLTKGTPHLPLSSQDQSHSVKRAQTIPTESPATPSNPPASIIRPADIYRRMREEQKAHQSVLVQPSTDQRTPATSTSVASPPTNNTPTETPESSAPLPVQHSGSAFEGKAGELNDSAATPITANEPPAISLPDVKRLSAFNPILPASELNPQGIQDPENQPHQLQHNPSLGFRSAVNQAFDVPETPSTVTDSIARSNSDSTTAISPIISRRDATDDKTPTIEEDPNENVNEGADTPTEANAVFKPGHRRDLSLPSPGNSPSRRPMITETNISASSDLAQISTGTPSESPQEAPPSTQQHSATTDSIQHRHEMSKRDLPAPLNVQTNVASGPTVTAEHVPVIIPSISAENSPEDTENDRLRKEIIRSLSRENTPSDQQDHDTPPQTGKQDNLTPREIQSSWNEPHGGDPSVSQLSGAAPNALQTASEAPPAVPAALSPAQDSQPALQRRFSWEEPSDDDNPTTVAQAQPQPPLTPGQDTLSPESIHPVPATAPTSQTSEAGDHIGGKDQPGLSEPKLTVVPPPVEDGVNIPSSSQAPGSAHSQTTEIPARTEDEQSFSRDQQSPELPAQAPSASFESGLLGFKDILNMQSSEERVKAFDRTRIQFAAIDTGLSNWVQVTVQSHPEHSDVVERNSKPLSDEFKNSVPRAKFPKLSSLGTLASSLQDGSHSSSGHTRRPSVPLGSTKQHQVGKDFLHTAGVLGGQAGKAAKGLFSKGRSKWKGSGGNEKVEP
ncbi:uncharacterized protein BJX67DRAFT_110337 [Aspergillus lucknowensis]|uniref:Uncharacterized protein n=1 Tax=Aspergillus lucknowensis TaxID=176173 RepID=A0ABR4LR99_9EURO